MIINFFSLLILLRNQKTPNSTCSWLVIEKLWEKLAPLLKKIQANFSLYHKQEICGPSEGPNRPLLQSHYFIFKSNEFYFLNACNKPYGYKIINCYYRHFQDCSMNKIRIWDYRSFLVLWYFK